MYINIIHSLDINKKKKKMLRSKVFHYFFFYFYKFIKYFYNLKTKLNCQRIEIIDPNFIQL